MQKNNDQAKQNQTFALLMVLVFVLLPTWRIFTGKASASNGTFLIAAFAIGVLALIFPALFSIPCKLWMGLGRLLSRVTTPVILTLFWYLVLTPMGFIHRKWMGDPLDRRWKDGINETAWVDRSKEKSSLTSYKMQF